uniref:Uncharacterized protein n=1 Tax=Timema shepardi TaxID=629360 RepID=A0A7R9B4J1_TIMSH|nr:unnamed protein product [Timema shepardi]
MLVVLSCSTAEDGEIEARSSVGCWEKFKSQARKQKQLERQHSMKTGGGEPYKTSPAGDELAAQVLTIQPWLDEEIVTPWDSDARYLEDAALVHTINYPETNTSTSTTSDPHIPIRSVTPQPSTSNETLSLSIQTQTPLISIQSVPGPSTIGENVFLTSNSTSLPPPSQSPRVPESMQHSSCGNPASVPTPLTSTPSTSSALKVLKRAARSRPSSSNTFVEAEIELRSRKFEEELKCMRETHKKKLDNEALLHAARSRYEVRLLEHQEQLQVIRLEREKLMLERERHALRAAKLDVEIKELELARARDNL